MAQYRTDINELDVGLKHRYEVVMLADQYGNITSGTGGTATDSFGRLRVSQPLTLFDSSHRYRDNNLWATSTSSGCTATFSPNEGLINLSTTTASGVSVIRETTKVFSYQPGKSLLVLNTFVMNPAQANLRQRVGYFGTKNGMYLELDGNNLSFVERSSVTGSVVENKISRLGGVYGANDTGWNVDKMDGNGPSNITLDITKAQIMWMDIEWLGLGTVRLGFVVDGKFIHCHSFHHANIVNTTYITTASLPLRYEITNTGTTASGSTLKQICSTVISEGGYELRGLQQGVGTDIQNPKTLTTAGVTYPIVSLRLKSSSPDAIAILSAISIMGLTNNANYNWSVVASATTSGGTWTDAGSNSAVEYKLNGTAISGGRILAQGYTSATTQAITPVDILKEALFKFQLERDSLAGVNYEIALCASTQSAGALIHGSVDWEEISR